jgi:hypothetical protein
MDQESKPMSESEKAEILRLTSPEFQESIKLEKAEEAKRRAAEFEQAIAEQKRDDRAANTMMAFLWLLALAVVLGLIYALIKFVKWAWYN